MSEPVLVAADDEAGTVPYAALEARIEPEQAHSVADLVERARRDQAGRRWVALLDGEPVGLANCGPSPLSRPGQASAWLGVLEERRRQGVGSALWARVVERARECGWTALSVWVASDRPDGLAFARARGFEQVALLQELELDLRPPLPPTDAPPAGVRIVSLAGLEGSEAVLRGLWEVDQETLPDTPGPEPLEAPDWESWRRRHLPMLLRDPRNVTVALAGDEVVGWAAIALRDGGRLAQHRGTGVRRAYRGRGLARAIKQVQLADARARGIERLITQNEERNLPMRRVNERLGYRPRAPKLWLEATLPAP